MTGAGGDDRAATAGGGAGPAPARMPVLTTARPPTAGHGPRGEAVEPARSDAGQRPDDTGASTGAVESRTAGPTPPRLQHPTLTAPERTRAPDSEMATPPSERVSQPSSTGRRAGERQRSQPPAGTPDVDATGGPTTGPAVSVPVIREAATLPVTAQAAMAGRGRRAATDTGDAAASPGVLTHLSPASSEPGRAGEPDVGGGKPLIDGRTDSTAIQTAEMPPLTLQRTGGVAAGSDGRTRQPADTQSSRGQRGRSGEPAGGERPGRSEQAGVGPARQDTRAGRDDHARRVERSLRPEPQPGGHSERQAGDRASPPEGSATATRYPDLTVKTLAPRIDVTRREETTRDITHTGRTPSDPPEQRSGEAAALDSLFRAVEGGGGQSRPPAAVDQVVERLYRRIERKRRVERERRGL